MQFWPKTPQKTLKMNKRVPKQNFGNYLLKKPPGDKYFGRELLLERDWSKLTSLFGFLSFLFFFLSFFLPFFLSSFISLSHYSIYFFFLIFLNFFYLFLLFFLSYFFWHGGCRCFLSMQMISTISLFIQLWLSLSLWSLLQLLLPLRLSYLRILNATR